MDRFIGVLGIATMMGLAFAFSTNRRAIRLKTVLWGLGLQFAFALLVLRIPWGQVAIKTAGDAVTKLLGYAVAGSSFVFGDLGKPPLGVFAFTVLTTIIFVSAFFAMLYHFGVMQFIVRIIAWVMTRLMGASGAESLNVGASIFIGQTEAPLTIRPFLPSCTRSELMTIMTAGMAHVSGGIMAAYINFGIEASHLLAAVIMTAPGTILISKMLVPETEVPVTAPHRIKPGAAVAESPEFDINKVEMPKDANVLGAIARGTSDGLQLALNVAAMLIAILALVALLNGILGWTHNHISWFPGSLQAILGPLFAPVAWVIGVPWKDCMEIGNLLGTRMVINEFVAFSQLGPMKSALDPRSFAIATFALCGFANFSSIGIQIGGIGALAPNKRDELARLGFRAMLAGTMANLMSASIVGILMK
ncbi:MAG TPA: nucleoside transporter C-terminal domain-containing protein [Terriglobales bacterium]|nr:nucleoside transporter C-terminal domain-containing protein [Terriglobales bacterium]